MAMLKGRTTPGMPTGGHSCWLEERNAGNVRAYCWTKHAGTALHPDVQPKNHNPGYTERYTERYTES